MKTDQYSQAFVQLAIRYLQTGAVPYQTPSERDAFRAKCDELTTDGTTLRLKDRRVVPNEQIDTTLQEIYDTLGDIGRDRFFGLVQQRYIGVSRRSIDTFLKNQELHQLVARPRRQRVVRPITASKPMERWQADLVDMQKYRSVRNANHGYLMCVVDCFSKFAWVEPLYDKSAETVAAAMTRIFAKAGTPSIVQTDRGKEFEGEFTQLLASRHVNLVQSMPYSPKTNGQVERFNQTLKRMISAHMTRFDTKLYVDVLPRLVAHYNAIPHSTTACAPNTLHFDASLLEAARQRIEKRASASIKPRSYTPLYPGDSVRVTLILKPLSKSKTFWSNEIFTVRAIGQDGVYWLSNQQRVTRDRLQRVDPANMVHMAHRKAEEKKKSVPEQRPRRQLKSPSYLADYV